MTTRIILGHTLDRLREMPSDSVHMVWTSPPYWGLRNDKTEPQVWGGDPDCAHVFGVDRRIDRRHKMAGESRSTLQGTMHSQRAAQFVATSNTCTLCGAWCGEHGLEPSLDLWLQHEVEIFREVRRVLRPDGTLWLNIGDAYCSSENGRSAADQKATGTDDRTFRDKPFDTASASGLKPKQRLMLPARLALALQADGWWLRDEIVWHKLNPMPSSVKDRTTPAHEMLYLLTKRARYYFDGVAISEPIAESSEARYSQPTIDEQKGGAKQDAYEAMQPGQSARSRRPNEILQSLALANTGTRQKRSVWSLALEPFPGAHFATAPTSIVRPAILAGTSARGVCPHCGAPWVRKVTTELVRTAKGVRANVVDERDHLADRGDQGSNRQKDGHLPGWRNEHQTTGWSPSCACPENAPIPATVLDPFGGAGTTALVAQELGRDAILIELNPDSVEIARARLREALGRVECDMPEPACDLPMFEKLGVA